MSRKRTSQLLRLALPLAAQSVVGLSALTANANGTWAVDADGSWSNPANWSGGGVPNGPDMTAVFGPVTTARRTVTVDAPETVSEIVLNSANGYNIGGAGTITFAGSKNTGTVANTGGSHTISAPLVLATQTSFNNLAGSPTLTISGPISAAGTTITTAGNGTIEFSNLQAKTLKVTAGTTCILPTLGGAATTLGSVTFSFSSGLDLSNNDLQLTNGGPNAFSDTGLLIKNGIRGLGVGGPAAIFSSNARADSAHRIQGELTGAQYASLGHTDFDGLPFSASDILVKYTIPGDTNFDGTVNALDFNALARNFGTFANWFNGDLNYDGFVNSLDFTALAQNFGSSLPTPSAPAPALGTTVPEPNWVGVLGCVGVMMMSKRR